jgi:hypothetical protein
MSSNSDNNKKTIGQRLQSEIDELSQKFRLMEDRHNLEISELNQKIKDQEATIARLKKVTFSLLLQAPVDDSDTESEEKDDLHDDEETIVNPTSTEAIN